mmetsp:Transcript_3393/g.4218  ORF Transcript_3393/g.4218 Transcript_3393/m.4218 type:complete len:86 (+) Transcript_3393:132-389(+)
MYYYNLCSLFSVKNWYLLRAVSLFVLNDLLNIHAFSLLQLTFHCFPWSLQYPAQVRRELQALVRSNTVNGSKSHENVANNQSLDM